jgi:hypothetical protein
VTQCEVNGPADSSGARSAGWLAVDGWVTIPARQVSKAREIDASGTRPLGRARGQSTASSAGRRRRLGTGSLATIASVGVGVRAQMACASGLSGSRPSCSAAQLGRGHPTANAGASACRSSGGRIKDPDGRRRARASSAPAEGLPRAPFPPSGVLTLCGRWAAERGGGRVDGVMVPSLSVITIAASTSAATFDAPCQRPIAFPTKCAAPQKAGLVAQQARRTDAPVLGLRCGPRPRRAHPRRVGCSSSATLQQSARCCGPLSCAGSHRSWLPPAA